MKFISPLLIGLMAFSFFSCTTSQKNDQAQEKTNEQKETDKDKDDKKDKQSEKLTQFEIDIDHGIPRGLEKGAIAPPFKALSQNGDSIDLDKLLEQGPVVLIFYRGQWCPVCNKYLSSLEDSLDQLRNKGVSIMAITPETLLEKIDDL